MLNWCVAEPVSEDKSDRRCATNIGIAEIFPAERPNAPNPAFFLAHIDFIWRNNSRSSFQAARRRPPRGYRESAPRHPNGLGVTGSRDGTWNTLLSSSRIPVSVPPHRQPLSSISTLAFSISSCVDQWPQMMS